MEVTTNPFTGQSIIENHAQHDQSSHGKGGKGKSKGPPKFGGDGIFTSRAKKLELTGKKQVVPGPGGLGSITVEPFVNGKWQTTHREVKMQKGGGGGTVSRTSTFKSERGAVKRANLILT